MGRGRIIAAFSAVSAVLLTASILFTAVSDNRTGSVFGGIFAPLLSYEPAVASVGGERIYRRDLEMFRLTAKLGELSGGEASDMSDCTDAEALNQVIELVLLARSAADNGVSPDAATLDAALGPLYAALDTEPGKTLRDGYRAEFGRSDKAFGDDLRNTVLRALTVKIFLLSLYYTASAQGMVSSDLSEEQAVETLRAKLLTKLRVENDIEIYRGQSE